MSLARPVVAVMAAEVVAAVLLPLQASPFLSDRIPLKSGTLGAFVRFQRYYKNFSS
jgi:hypothetical protein